ncbi:Bro-N domain-containing protein [Methylobacterium sp. DB0501]|uniref:BRO-N domain-containing protein n=1 Tax=Methylobacterium sp. DB0501 TaxID=2709665 RepID=UPI0013ED1A28|nr:Bro-N domain-containing protein [Methylobacterium sp. DB0501]NGM39033.1 Bro-N domain-containing protein [Methylobacterium sp. DB0501]
MQYEMKVFQDQDRENFRVLDRGGDPWFVLTDVCRKLEIGNPSDAAKRLDDDEKGVATIDTPGGRQPATIISESGLYSLILTSRKEGAKAFRKWVTSEVLPSIRKTGSYHGRVPAFIKRYNENWDRIDPGHFSVLNELVIHLWGRLEHAGRTMADFAPDGKENRPDVSVGRCFSDWLKANHPTVSTSFSYYMHKTPEAEVEARQYPFSMLPLFREYLDTVWIPERAPGYLKTRDPEALPYLQKLLPSPDKPKPGMMRTPTKLIRKAS